MQIAFAIVSGSPVQVFVTPSRYAISPTQSQPSLNEFAFETDSDYYLEFRVYAYVDISWG